jgi:hypothetical protein
VIENILIANSIEGQTATLTFDSFITGSNVALECTFSFIFSNEIENFTNTVVLSPSPQQFSFNVPIPSGYYGPALLNIANNLCVNTKSYIFEIQQSLAECVEWMSGECVEWMSGEVLEWID